MAYIRIIYSETSSGEQISEVVLLRNISEPERETTHVAAWLDKMITFYTLFCVLSFKNTFSLLKIISSMNKILSNTEVTYVKY